MSDYKPVIGLEIHVELKTKSKMFCQCSADYFTRKPNTNVCPVCLALPGALPVPNKKAIEWTILIGKALNCQINKLSKFDRKHYFYPDLPKGYQISQYDEPIAVNGKFKSQNFEAKINRVHLEEDTGKLIHFESDTLIDFNRCGLPLVEIVTEPVFDNSEDVVCFLQELQILVRYLGVSDADMEKGTMRMEPNISLSSNPNKLPNYKVEVKNINSFKFVKKAIEYELKRQMEILKNGKTPNQETRGWDSNHNKTNSQRSKEEAHDYRYFPEPDIPPLNFDNNYLEKIFSTLPELPAQKVKRYEKEFGLKPNDAFRITRDIKTANYFEKVMSKPNIKSKNLGQAVANVILNKKLDISLPVSEFIPKLLALITPKDTDEKLLESSIIQVIKLNPKVVADFKSGRENAIMYLVGQVMREMKGKADARKVISVIKSKI